MVETAKQKELDSYRKMILGLLPNAQKIIKKALKPRRTKRDCDGKVIKQEKIPPKALDLARYVMDQYAKMIIPSDSDIHELHIIDHAMLSQMKKAKRIVEEMNRFQRNRDANADLN